VHDVTDNGNNCDGTAQSGRHVDCIQILSGQYVTIRNSRFYGCATSNILAQPYIAPLDHITIENNFFGPPVRAGNNVYLGGGTCTAVVYRFNTSPDMGVTGGCSDPIAAYGNIMKNWSCTSGVAYSDNVFVPGSVVCGSIARQCAPTFAASSLSSADYHLSGTDSCARDGVRPASYPATDADGQARPSGASPDAGADETG